MKILSLAIMTAVTTFALVACGGGNDTSSPPPTQRIVMAGALPAKSNTLIMPQPRTAYTVENTLNGYVIKDTATGTSTIAAANISRIQFADISMALDIDVAGGIYRLYRAAFNRQPDLGGFGFWLDAVMQGQTLEQVALGFVQSPEFINLFGAHPTDQEFITKLYSNVLHRTPDSGGMTFWLSALSSGVSRATILVNFSESPENIAQVAPMIQGGIPYAQNGVAYQPVAKAGEDQQAKVAASVTLNGSDSSDANGDTLSYTWSLIKPAGSYATATSYNQSTLTFTPDVAGTYTATLTVTDGKLLSTPDAVNIIVTAPIVPAIPDTGIYSCSTITHAYALQLYNQGHTYLDRDHDGKPCEATDISVEVAATKPTTPSSPSTGMCYVKGYTRKNGTYVSGYWRRC